MFEKTTMRILVAVFVTIVVASLVVGVVARHRHHSHSDSGGPNGAAEGRHSRRGVSRRGYRGSRDPLESAFNVHMDRVKDFHCSVPVPMALHVLSLQDDIHWSPATHEEFEPETTILHRCGESSGCCLNHMHSCQAVELAEVPLVFSVVDTVTGRKRYEQVMATNHTRCGCFEKSLQPK